MVFSRVSTLGQSSQLLIDSLRQQGRQFEFQRQVSSGTVSDDYKGLARDVLTLNATKSTQAAKTQYVQNIEFATLRTQRYQFAMDSLDEGVDLLRTTALNVNSAYDGSALMTTVRSVYELTTQLVNTQESGRYLFSGTRTDTAPWNEDFVYPDGFLQTDGAFAGAGVDLTGVTPAAGQTETYDLTFSANTNITAEDVGSVVEINVGGTTVSAVVTAFTDAQNLQITNPQPEAAISDATTPVTVAGGVVYQDLDTIFNQNYQGNDEIVSLNIDEGQTINYGVTGSSVSERFLKTIGRIVQYDNNADYTNTKPLAEAQRQFLVDQLSEMVASIDDIGAEQTKNGLNGQLMDDTKERLEDEQTFLEELESSIEDVNAPEAISNLNLSDTALRASFQVLSRVQSIQLLDFI